MEKKQDFRQLFRAGEEAAVYFEIADDPELGIVCCTWIGYTDTDCVKQGSGLILEYVQRYQRRLLMVNSRREEGPWNDSNPWIIDEWFPEVTLAGLEKTAILFSDNIFSIASTREHVDMANERGYMVNMFEEEKEAIAWLLSDGEEFDI